tara:strand:- start:1192 stop:1440 length:249 start_codon:yes stop_codon:yes gene_type:complete
MVLFKKKAIEKGAIINSDEDLQWHINNQDDKNRYVIVRSKFTDFNNSKFLDRVNTLINNNYKPQGGISSGDGYTFQALYRNK